MDYFGPSAVFMMTTAAEPVIAVNVEDYMERESNESEGWLVDDTRLG